VPLPANSYVPQVAPREAEARAARRVWIAASFGASALVGLVFAAPLLAAAGNGLAGFGVYRVFAALCHQRAERSFWLAGQPLAVCARCLGVYAGFAACLLLYPLARPLRRTAAPAPRWLALALLPAALDLLLDFAGLWQNTHWSRALTGAVAGAVAVFYVVPGLVDVGRGGWRNFFAAPAARAAHAPGGAEQT
jgi:uncharacterized membrane protein